MRPYVAVTVAVALLVAAATVGLATAASPDSHGSTSALANETTTTSTNSTTDTTDDTTNATSTTETTETNTTAATNSTTETTDTTTSTTEGTETTTTSTNSTTGTTDTTTSTTEPTSDTTNVTSTTATTNGTETTATATVSEESTVTASANVSDPTTATVAADAETNGTIEGSATAEASVNGTDVAIKTNGTVEGSSDGTDVSLDASTSLPGNSTAGALDFSDATPANAVILSTRQSAPAGPETTPPTDSVDGAIAVADGSLRPGPSQQSRSATDGRSATADDGSRSAADGDRSVRRVSDDPASDASSVLPVSPALLAGRDGVGAVVLGGLGLGLTAAAWRSWQPTTRAVASAIVDGPAVRLRSLLDRLRRYVVGLGYSRYDDSDPLDHETRATLYERIEQRPGVHLSALAEHSDAPLSTVRHHLDVLADENLVYDASIRGRRRYFALAETEPELQAALADDATASVVEALDRVGPASVTRLATELDRDRSTVSHHLDRLESDGVVERERDGRAVSNRLAPSVRAALSGMEADVEAETDEGLSAPSDD